MRKKIYFAGDGELFRRGNPKLLWDTLMAFAQGKKSYTVEIPTDYSDRDMDGVIFSPELREYRSEMPVSSRTPEIPKKNNPGVTMIFFDDKNRSSRRKVGASDFREVGNMLFYGLGFRLEWPDKDLDLGKKRPTSYLIATDDRRVTRLTGYPGPNYPKDPEDIHQGDPEAEEAFRHAISYPPSWVKANPNPSGLAVARELERMLTSCLDQLSPTLVPKKKYGIPKQFAEKMKGYNPERYPDLFRQKYTEKRIKAPIAPRKVWELSTGGVQFLFSVLLKILQESRGKELTNSEITRISGIDFIVRPPEIIKPWGTTKGGNTYAKIEKGVREIYATSWELEGLRKIINPETDVRQTARVLTECRIVGKMETFQTSTTRWTQYNIDPLFLKMCKDEKMLSQKTLTTIFTDIKAKPGSDLYWAALHVHSEVVVAQKYHISTRTLYSTLTAKVSGTKWEDLETRLRWDYEKRVVEKIPAALEAYADKYTLSIRNSVREHCLVLYKNSSKDSVSAEPDKN